ncbi:BRO-N domain-containing protein [Pseudomonas sp.]|uniref:BRO-N domain-containing protein n=1 Tax=Pseudomonas sp. TaxID=306 RepID=UPI003FD71EB5
MAGTAEQAGGSLKRRSPGVQARASDNEINFGEENVMSDISTAVSNVIPFKFGKQQVRTLLIDDQPWFVASDVSAALQYSEASAMTRHLDDDEKGLSIVQTLGGDQEMLVINESGLYSAILRSRKAEARRFKKWVTAEVLPAIRKRGRYEDHGKMATLMDELIGMSELNVIKGLIRDKSKAVPADQRQGFQLVMHNRLHTRFNVPRTELIPAAQFEQVCNFIGSYALEGEFLGKEEPKPAMSIHYPIETLTARREGMLIVRNEDQAWLDVTMHDLRDLHGSGTPLEQLLWELEQAGFDIEGAWWELRTYRNKLREFSSFVTGMGRVAEEPHRYAVKTPKARAAA